MRFRAFEQNYSILLLFVHSFIYYYLFKCEREMNIYRSVCHLMVEKVTQRLSLALVTRICCKIDSIGPRVQRRNASEILSADTDSKRGNGES